MDALTACVVEDCSPGRFIRLQQGQLLSRRPTLLIAELSETAVLLGRYQRRWSAIQSDTDGAIPVLRRIGGGRALTVGRGIAAVSLALQEPGFSAEKTMNRGVRGLLSAIGSSAGTPAHYFGRDAVILGGKEVASLSQEGLGPVLFEAYVAVSGPLDRPAARYPGHGDPRVETPSRGTLGRVTFAVLADALVRAYGARPGSAPEEGDDPSPPVDEDATGLGWSGWADVPIGFVEALAGPEVVRLRGDFIAPSATIAALERRLAGGSRADVRLAVAEAFEGSYLIGVADPQILAEAVLAAR